MADERGYRELQGPRGAFFTCSRKKTFQHVSSLLVFLPHGISKNTKAQASDSQLSLRNSRLTDMFIVNEQNLFKYSIKVKI